MEYRYLTQTKPKKGFKSSPGIVQKDARKETDAHETKPHED